MDLDGVVELDIEVNLLSFSNVNIVLVLDMVQPILDSELTSKIPIILVNIIAKIKLSTLLQY